LNNAANVEALFFAALEHESAADRAAYLDSACSDADLRCQVEKLLKAHPHVGDFLKKPAVEQLARGSEQALATLELDGTTDDQKVLAPNKSGPAAEPTEGGLADNDDQTTLDFLRPSTKSESLGRIGHYEVLELVGRGAFGIVFRAFDDVLQRVVAVKVLAPQLAASTTARKRFLREARSSARVRHENVVQVYAVEEQPLPFLVMEFVPGETLQQRLERTGPLDAMEVAQIGRQLALGLAAAHGMGLIHRDVKPANILIESGPNPRAKISDFGLARSPDDSSLTQIGIVAGTPMFMAPEQANGESFDHRADLFSLGSVLYTMCTGSPPFRAKSPFAVFKRVIEDSPQPIPEIVPQTPEWLCALIARLHSKKPEDRFASAQEVAELLDQHSLRVGTTAAPSAAQITGVQTTLSPQATPVTVPASKPRFGTRWTAAAVIAVALIGCISFTEAAGLTSFRSIVIRLFSPDGTLVVEVDDPGISVKLDGTELVIAGAGIAEIRLRPGRYTVDATKAGKLLRHELVTVTKNGREVVRVSQEAPASVGNKPVVAIPDTTVASAATWERSVAQLPAAQRVKAVANRLQQLNPGFDGAVESTIEHGLVRGLKFNTTHVIDISPVRVLTELRSLSCNGSDAFKGQLVNETDGQLNVRSVDKSRLSDLGPLKGLPLTDLSFVNSDVYDLTPLEGMKLTSLECSSTKVYDLTPLMGMPLEKLHCGFTKVVDLSPLRGMKLTQAAFDMSEVSDLTPLRGMPLQTVGIGRHVTDLTPLRGMSLHFLGAYRAERLIDLSPLKGMSLTGINLQGTMVSDISTLKGMPLNDLNIPNTKVSDLTPLLGMSTLRRLSCGELVTDLSPLRKLGLEQIYFHSFKSDRDAMNLRAITTLQRINGMPAAEFWKEADAQQRSR
jgi:eukaryotic-like serine/threonine-protein kinase